MSSRLLGVNDEEEAASLSLTSKAYLHPSHPSSTSSEENFIHHVSTVSASEGLLDHAFRQPIYPRPPMWKRLLTSIIPGRRKHRSKERHDGLCLHCEECVRLPRRRKGLRACISVALGILVMLGVVQILTLLASLFAALFPGNVSLVIESWGQIGQEDKGLSSWPTDFTRDISPLPCHSHNDYWRLVPVYSALSAGCISIEADIWLFDEELYVGHTTSSLSRDRTLKSLYIDPLLDILSKQNPNNEFQSNDTTASFNGVFDTDPSQSLTLLIDFKTAGATLWPYVLSALQPLRDRHYLTRENGTDVIPGPITVIGTGNTPFDLLSSNVTNPSGDVFFDAPLDEMWEDREWEEANGWPDWDEGNPGEVLVEEEGSAEEDDALGDHPWGTGRHVYKPGQHKSYLKGVPDLPIPESGFNGPDNKGQGKTGAPLLHPDIYTPLTSSYASVSFGKSIGRMWRNRLSPRQMGLIRGQIRGAHRRGLKVRYWNTPSWPVGLRNHVWDVLVREGVDLLNVDDLRAVRGGKWGEWAERTDRGSWWWR